MYGKLTQHVAADKSNSASKYCPYSFSADVFIYYCLPSPIASAEVHQSSYLTSAVKPLSYTVMWLMIHLADFSFGVRVNCSSGIPSGAATFLWYSAFFSTWFTLSTSSLLSCGRCGSLHSFSLMFYFYTSSFLHSVCCDSSVYLLCL